jgi:hypothetical protein
MCNVKLHRHVSRTLSVEYHIISKFNPVHTFTVCSCEMRFNVILHQCFFFQLFSSIEIFQCFIWQICLYATCFTLFILHLITLASVKITNSEAPLRTSDTVVSQWLGMLKTGQSVIPFLAGTGECSLPECPYCLQCTHTYLMVTGFSSHGGKVAGAWN